ncbi:MAG: outer membrane protein transport protein [Sulfurimonadaceae bacterium]
MKKTIKLALVASLALGATSAFATNGTSLIGYGAKSRGMGGTGVAQFQGAESGFNNPALLGQAEGTEVSIGGTYFAPDVSYSDNNTASGAVETVDSKASASMIPAVSSAEKVNDSFAWGLALYGVGGMGVDFRDATTTSQAGMLANDNLLLMRFSVPMAYTVAGISLGLAPVIEYGALSMNVPAFGQSGVTTDIAYGFELGAAYSIAGVTLGLDYKSKVTHDFEDSFNSDMTGGTQSKLDTPAVIAAGVSYNFMKNHTVALDYKNIAYGSAKGFEDFGWNDMNVFALGYEFAADTWAVRVGYNHGDQPIETSPDTTSMVAVMGSYGSMLMFPGVTEDHYSVGGSYAFSAKTSLDAAFVYGTGEATVTDAMGPGSEFSATNDQVSATVALNYNF